MKVDSDHDIASKRFIGLRIRQARKEKGLSQRELAERLEPPRAWGTISMIERGVNNVSARDLLRLSQILERPVEWFVNPAFTTDRFFRPTTPYEWERLYPDNKALANAHANVDALFERGVNQGRQERDEDAREPVRAI